MSGMTAAAMITAPTDAPVQFREKDSNGDGIPDYWWVQYGEDPATTTAATEDWDGDGLMDIVYACAGANASMGSIFLLRNCGTKTEPVFENPRTLRCFGKPIFVTNHGPHPWVGDYNGDGKVDVVTCVEWSVYPYYSHAAMEMGKRPTVEVGKIGE